MPFFNAMTNKDCEKCFCSYTERTSESDFDERRYSCQAGHHINNQFDTSKKGCELPAGEYYEGETKLKRKKQ